MSDNYKDYVLLTAVCTACDCSGAVITVRAKDDGEYFLFTGTACAEAELEITADIFNSLIQQYIAVNDTEPVTL